MRFTIEEYCERFQLSKAMVNLQIRTDQVEYVTENGITYIIVKSNTQQNENLPAKPKTTVGVILSLYRQENRLLKEKIKQLEAKIDTLIADKEQMLREERERIEQLYRTKDEQLKKILELLNTKMMLENNPPQEEEEIINVSLNKSIPLVELKQYLKSMELHQEQKKRIKKRFFDAKDQDIRIIEQNGKIYLDFAKYDYTDLLKL
jgi:hypothetical protein